MKSLNLISLFAGIGAVEMGAYRVYDKVNLIAAAEIDKFARQSYAANHDIDEAVFYTDVRKLDGTKYTGKADCVSFGFPCQDYSIAGKRAGLEGQRGTLFYEGARIVKEVQPDFFIAENVKGLLSSNGGKDFKTIMDILRDDVGYYCHCEVVNTKDYGVPQNRERVFIIGFKDHDHYHRFEMAAKVQLVKRLKDVLEDDVDEKYYLKRKLDTSYESQANTIHDTSAPGPTLCAGTHGYALGYIEDTNRINRINRTNRTIRSGGGSSMSDKHCFDLIKVPSATKSGYETATTGDSINLSVPNSKTRRGRVGKQVAQTLDTQCNQAVVEPMIVASRGRNKDNPNDRTAGAKVEQRFEVNESGTSNCLTSVQKDNYVLEPTTRIRKLTPRECLRLQDFPDTFKQVCSDSQQYKQAGNSMSVNILEMIFRQIEKAQSDEPTGTLLDFC